MKVLAYTPPARGHLYPLVPILTELRERGHDVAVRTLAAEVDALCAAGIPAKPVDVRVERLEHDDFRARTPVGSVRRSAAVLSARAVFEIDDLRGALDEEQPAALIVDANCWGAAAVAETSGLPWAALLPYPTPLPSRAVPPFGPGLPLARGAAGRVRDRLLRPLVFGATERAFTPRVNAVRRRAGAPELTDAADLFARPPLTLYLTAEPFEYPRPDWPAGYRLVGPINYDPPADPPDWLDAVTRPIVLVTTSSEFQDDGRLVSTALDALRDEDVFVVATLPAGEAGRFAVPPNARVERWIPHSAVLPRAACVITHGGMGATQKALAAGVPVVAVPFGRDQFEVARRLEASGAGVRLPPRRLSPERLRGAVRAAIGRRAAAEALARALAAAGGAPRAADELEALAASPPR